MRKSVIAAALIVFLAPSAALPQAKSGKSGVYEQLNLFGEAFERIRHDAVEAVADKKLIETAIAGMLNGLDPHSVYLNESEYKALQTPSVEESASTGLVVTHDNGQLKVVAPRDGSPAAAANIKPGDVIFTIDKEPTYDLTLPEIEQKLRGKDYGTRLIKAIEDEARKFGATQSYLDTMSFQAPGFYRACGYEEFGSIEGYPGGVTRHWFTKAL